MEYLKEKRFWNDNYLGHNFFAYKMKNICWNCPSYGWIDPMSEIKSVSPLLVCKSCKVAMYCSKECQKEHWKKVHKKHCKYLSGQEPSPILSHGSGADCRKCKSMKDRLGVFPCHIQQSFSGPLREWMLPDVRQCVQLGELTGHFVSKLDKNISILQQIFAVFQEISKDQISDPYIFVCLARSLTSLRVVVWYQSLLSKTEEDIDKNVEGNLWRMRVDILFPLITSVVRCQKFVVPIIRSVCDKLWESFIFFLNIFLQATSFYKTMFDLQYIHSESFELSKETRELRDQVFGSKFLTIWETLLEAANDKMIPMEELLEIYCDGPLQRTCGICSTDIKVSSFYPYGIMGSEMYGTKEDPDDILRDELADFLRLFEKWRPFISFCQKQYFSCAQPSCQEKTDMAVIRSKHLTVATGQQLIERFVLNRCDSCYKVTEGAHRCSNCKMKLYCSEVCQNNDWAVHKICCEDLKKSDDKRKKKKHGRKKAGTKRMIKQEKFGKEVNEGGDFCYSFMKGQEWIEVKAEIINPISHGMCQENL